MLGYFAPFYVWLGLTDVCNEKIERKILLVKFEETNL